MRASWSVGGTGINAKIIVQQLALQVAKKYVAVMLVGADKHRVHALRGVICAQVAG